MYHDRNNHYNIIDVNLFVPGLSVFENLAEGLIRGIGRITGICVVLYTRITRK